MKRLRQMEVRIKLQILQRIHPVKKVEKPVNPKKTEIMPEKPQTQKKIKPEIPKVEMPEPSLPEQTVPKTEVPKLIKPKLIKPKPQTPEMEVPKIEKKKPGK